MLIIWFILFVLIIWVSIIILGKSLPQTYKVERSAFIDAPPSMLWSIIVNHLKEKDWRVDLIQVVKMPNQDHKPVWKEVRRDKKIFMLKTILSEASHYVLEREIQDNKIYGGTFRYKIDPEEEGSRLTITHSNEVYKPITRVKYLMFPSAKHSFVNQYISDVKQRVLHLKEELE